MPYYDDAGNEINIESIPLPQLCLNCEKKDDPYEEILCNLNRFDQQGEKDFKCFAFVSRYGVLDDDILV
jgi:hypothetical protein